MPFLTVEYYCRLICHYFYLSVVDLTMHKLLGIRLVIMHTQSQMENDNQQIAELSLFSGYFLIYISFHFLCSAYHGQSEIRTVYHIIKESSNLVLIRPIPTSYNLTCQLTGRKGREDIVLSHRLRAVAKLKQTHFLHAISKKGNLVSQTRQERNSLLLLQPSLNSLS